MVSEHADKAFEEFDPNWDEKKYQKAEKEARKELSRPLSKPVTQKERVYWEGKDGKKIDIDTMSETYAKNVLKLIVTRGLLKDKLT